MVDYEMAATDFVSTSMCFGISCKVVSSDKIGNCPFHQTYGASYPNSVFKCSTIVIPELRFNDLFYTITLMEITNFEVPYNNRPWYSPIRR